MIIYISKLAKSSTLMIFSATMLRKWKELFGLGISIKRFKKKKLDKKIVLQMFSYTRFLYNRLFIYFGGLYSPE